MHLCRHGTSWGRWVHLLLFHDSSHTEGLQWLKPIITADPGRMHSPQLDSLHRTKVEHETPLPNLGVKQVERSTSPQGRMEPESLGRHLSRGEVLPH